MKTYLGQVKIADQYYFAELETDFISVFQLKTLGIKFQSKEKIDLCSGFFEELGDATLVFGTIKKGSSGTLEIHVFEFEYLIKGTQFGGLKEIEANVLNFESEILKSVFPDSIIRVDGNNEEVSKEPVVLLSNNDFEINYFNGTKSHWNRKMQYTLLQYKYLSLKSLGRSVNIWDLCKMIHRMKNLFYLLGFSDTEADQYSFVLFDRNEKVRFNLYGWNYKIKTDRLTYLKTYEIKFLKLFNKEQIEKWIFNEEFQKLFDLLFAKHFIKIHHRELAFTESVYVLERFHRKFYSFNSSFDKRIKYFRPLFEKILPDDTDVNQYLNKIERTRHSIAHFEDKPNVFKGIELYYAALYVEIIMVISLLVELGINNDEIDNLFKHSKNYVQDIYLHNKSLSFKIKSELFPED